MNRFGRYDDDWKPPHREVEQARCVGSGCTNNGQYPGPLCIAATLVDGVCAACRRGIETPTLRLDV